MTGLSDIPVCPLCASTQARFHWKKSGVTYVRCLSCTLIFQHPLPTPEQSKAVYSDAYYVKTPDQDACVGYRNYLENDSVSIAKKIFRTLEKLGPANSRRLLDVGCATGNLLQVAREHGWDTYGIEISPWAVERARQKGLTVYGKPLQECNLESSSFDVVTLYDVLEHFPDPKNELREIRRILKPGGWLIIETPNIDSVPVKLLYGAKSDLVQPNAHLVLFSKATLRRILEMMGFRVTKMRTFPLTRSFFTYFQMIIRRIAKMPLRALGYQIGPLDLRARVKHPDDSKFPRITINDCIQAVARKA
jgi:2-polyprenyl-3-methyl-5-hydroxy-6-metoxy-1,4-benzoquinol methylase